MGLIGAGIGASLSPELHEREGAEQGLRYRYRLIELDDGRGAGRRHRATRGGPASAA